MKSWLDACLDDKRGRLTASSFNAEKNKPQNKKKLQSNYYGAGFCISLAGDTVCVSMCEHAWTFMHACDSHHPAWLLGTLLSLILFRSKQNHFAQAATKRVKC